MVIMPTAVHIYRVRLGYSKNRATSSASPSRHLQTNQVPAHGTQPQQVVQLGMDAVVEELAQRQVHCMAARMAHPASRVVTLACLCAGP